MLNTAEVKMWGTTIGYLYLPEDRPFASFEYDKNFASSKIEVSPLKMPLSERVYEFPALVSDAFHGVPGMIADSLPDKFGNAVINNWLANQHINEADFNVIDRLCYTGARGMGALEFLPANGPNVVGNEEINIDKMVQLASEILNERESHSFLLDEDDSYSQLLQLGTSAGGARAKAIIAWNEKTNEIKSGQVVTTPDFDYWLMKFDGVSKNGDHGLEDSPKYTLIEYTYYQMALLAGINMESCKLFEESGRSHFMTKRFDRVNGKKIHLQTLGAMAHIDYNIPGLCSYEQAAGYMKEIGLAKPEIEQFFRRMVFNVIAVNQDDHVKNISFLMDKDGKWKLSPAYDVTFSYDERNRWLSSHQMKINNKQEMITSEDILLAGMSMGLSKKRMYTIIDEVRLAVGQWEELAKNNNVPTKTVNLIRKVMDEQKI